MTTYLETTQQPNFYVSKMELTMGRPRTPSQILALRGSFTAHPERRRADPEGAAPFSTDPPAHLPADCERAWHWIVARLPKVALFNTDEIAIEITARLLTQYWDQGELDTLKELRAWLSKLGFTPADRARLPAVSTRSNRYAHLKAVPD